jgi:hypothetical protein
MSHHPKLRKTDLAVLPATPAFQQSDNNHFSSRQKNRIKHKQTPTHAHAISLRIPAL